jgi:hypothetical protein
MSSSFPVQCRLQHRPRACFVTHAYSRIRPLHAAPWLTVTVTLSHFAPIHNNFLEAVFALPSSEVLQAALGTQKIT